MAREALAAFDASQRPAITRAFEFSLKNDNPRQRELAARELATWGGPNTSGLLLGLLEDGDVGVRCAAVVTLGKLKDPHSLDAILSRLMYDRAAATEALAAFGSGAEKPVLSLLKTGTQETRMAAAEVLGFIGTRESIPALHDAAVDNDLRLAAIAKESWRKIDPVNFTPGMESAVDMESEMTSRQREGLQRLVDLKPDKNQDRVAKMLVKMALSLDGQVREDARNVLATWGTKDTAPAFIDLLTEKTNPLRRQLAEAALGALKDPRGGPAVARWAVVDYPASIDALAEMGPVAEDSVIELLINERLDIRRDAVRILKSWGSKQKGIPALLALLTRERERERGNAVGPVLEKEILEAITTIRERPIIPRRPMTQPNKPVTQPAR
jgi:HEAT repeat protein